MDMELYVTKHRMLQDFLAKIGELLKKPVDKRAAEAISDEINKMTGVLNMHLLRRVLSIPRFCSTPTQKSVR